MNTKAMEAEIIQKHIDAHCPFCRNANFGDTWLQKHIISKHFPEPSVPVSELEKAIKNVHVTDRIAVIEFLIAKAKEQA